MNAITMPDTKFPRVERAAMPMTRPTTAEEARIPPATALISGNHEERAQDTEGDDRRDEASPEHAIARHRLRLVLQAPGQRPVGKTRHHEGDEDHGSHDGSTLPPVNVHPKSVL